MYRLTEYKDIKAYRDGIVYKKWEFYSAGALKERFSKQLHLSDNDVKSYYLGIPQNGNFFIRKAGPFNKDVYYKGTKSGRIWTFREFDSQCQYNVQDLIFAVADRIKKKKYNIFTMSIPYICFFIKAYYAMHHIDICTNDFYQTKKNGPKCKAIEKIFVGGGMPPSSWEFEERISRMPGESNIRYFTSLDKKMFFMHLEPADEEIVNQIVDEFSKYKASEIHQLFYKTKLYKYLKEKELTTIPLSFANMELIYEQIEKSEG